MTDDILIRLRACIDPDVNEPLDRLLRDAADEIERLKRAVEDAWRDGYDAAAEEAGMAAS